MSDCGYNYSAYRLANVFLVFCYNDSFWLQLFEGFSKALYFAVNEFTVVPNNMTILEGETAILHCGHRFGIAYIWDIGGRDPSSRSKVNNHIPMKLYIFKLLL